LVVQLPKGGVNGTHHLVDSTIDGLFHSRRLVAHRERLDPGETSLKEAALILSAEFPVAVIIAKVNFHPHGLTAEAFQTVPPLWFDLLRQFAIAFDIAIRVDLNDHVVLLSQSYFMPWVCKMTPTSITVDRS
jgi:hypothetical protein